MPVGKFSGQLVATGDGTRVSTPFGVEKESERYGVKLTNIGRDGKAPLQHVTFFDRIGDCGSDPYCGDYVYGEGTSTAELRLPPGEYTVVDFSTTTGTDWTMLAYSTLDHRADRSLVLDARKAKPVEMSVPKATARLMELSVVVARDMRRGPDSVFTYFQPGDAENPIYITELGEPAADPAQVVSVAYGRFAEPGPAGDFANSPYDYNLADYRQGRALDGVRLRTRQEQYATVKASYAADTAEPRTALTSHGVRPTGSALDYSLPPTGARELASALPVRRAEYYLADGFKWSTTLATLAEDGQLWTWLFNSERSVYRRGRTYQQEWNKGVLGPRLTLGPVTPNGLARGAQRDGDRLLFGLSLRSDSNPLHMNEPKLPAGSAKLYRNGELIKDMPRAHYFAAEVPADEATYRLDSRVEMPGTDVSPILESSWTFHSGHVEGTASLPLMAVHFQPVLDDHNHARAGRSVLPITVQRQPGAPAADVKTLQVETSTDDGKTWHPAKVTRTTHGWQTTVTNPPNAAMSLRAKASDTNGNEVTQTFIRGYLVRG